MNPEVIKMLTVNMNQSSKESKGTSNEDELKKSRKIKEKQNEEAVAEK